LEPIQGLRGVGVRDERGGSSEFGGGGGGLGGEGKEMGGAMGGGGGEEGRGGGGGWGVGWLGRRWDGWRWKWGEAGSGVSKSCKWSPLSVRIDGTHRPDGLKKVERGGSGSVELYHGMSEVLGRVTQTHKRLGGRGISIKKKT